MKIGDLIKDNGDGEVGLVVANGPGFYVDLPANVKTYPDGLMPSWKVKWPSMSGQLVDIGEDSLLCGDVEVISESR
jgi:hypothetical protein